MDSLPSEPPGKAHIYIILSYPFLAVLGLHCCSGFSPAVMTGGHSFLQCAGLLTGVASPVAEHGLWGTWVSVVGGVVPGLQRAGGSCGVQTQ